MLANLVSNALRYTPRGGQVTLSARVEDRWLLLAVADTGAGIAPADLPLVFERFYRADRARRRDAGHSGLGLAIARQLVEAHGGALTATSQVGVGSTFTVRLPLADRPATGGASRPQGGRKRRGRRSYPQLRLGMTARLAVAEERRLRPQGGRLAHMQPGHVCRLPAETAPRPRRAKRGGRQPPLPASALHRAPRPHGPAQAHGAMLSPRGVPPLSSALTATS